MGEILIVNTGIARKENESKKGKLATSNLQGQEKKKSGEGALEKALFLEVKYPPQGNLD
jgi:hypothetical protein